MFVGVIDYKFAGEPNYIKGKLDIDTAQLAYIEIEFFDLFDLRIEQGSAFASLIKPSSPENVSAKALTTNKLKIEELMVSPSLQLVWDRFVTHCKRYRRAGPPILCSFDKEGPILLQSMAEKFRDLDVDGFQKVFDNKQGYVLSDDIVRWFPDNKFLPNKSLESLRDFFGIEPESGAATIGRLQMRFLNLYRSLFDSMEFYKSFNKKED